MKIAVNTRFLLPDQLEGIGRFTHEILSRLTRRYPQHQFYFFFDRPFDRRFVYGPNVRPQVLLPPARHPFLFYIWFQYRVAAALQKIKPDVFLSTDGMTVLKTRVPRVTVIHDLALSHFPDDVGYWQRKYYQRYTPRFAALSEQLVTVSEYSRQDLEETCQVPAGRISVVYNAAAPHFKPVSFEIQVQTRQRYAAGEAYFIYVGAQQPRKNLENLFRAFDLFKAQTGSELKLLVVGRAAWKIKKIRQAHRQMIYRDEVVFTGRVGEAELPALYSAAVATVYVPFFEGFGLPVVEAQQCRCPVITSRASALPEVAGAGALLVDPLDPPAIAAAMTDVYLNLDTRSRLVAAGLENARRFSWEASAEVLMRVLEKAAKEKD